MGKKKSGRKKGLTAKTYKGLSKKRMDAAKGGGVRFKFKRGEPQPIMFFETPDEMRELDQHQFQDEGRWQYVPCTGEECPLCEDEDEDVAKTRYRFACNVYNLEEKKVQVLEGPRDLAHRIAFRYERKPSRFLKRVYDVTQFDGTPISYQIDLADEEPVRISNKKPHDLDKYIDKAIEFYYGDKKPKKDSLEDDDEEFEDEEEYTEEELEDMSNSELKSIAKEFGVSIKGKKPSEVIKEIMEEQE